MSRRSKEPTSAPLVLKNPLSKDFANPDKELAAFLEERSKRMAQVLSVRSQVLDRMKKVGR